MNRHIIVAALVASLMLASIAVSRAQFVCGMKLFYPPYFGCSGGLGSSGGGGGSCTGVIDASTGCPLPMLGGA